MAGEVTMGLLDALQSPEAQLGLGLLSAAGPSAVPMSFGQRLGGAMQQFQAAKIAEDERRQKAAMQALQAQLAQQQLAEGAMKMKAQQSAMDDHERQRAFLSSLPSPQTANVQQALSGGGGPTVSNAAQMRQIDPHQQMMFDAMKAGVLPVQQYLSSLQKDESPLTVKEGESLVDRKTLKPLFANPKTHEQPSAVREYQFAVSQGYPKSFAEWELERKKAGATNIAVNTEKSFLGSVATKLGEQIDNSLAGAKAAASSINTAQSIKSAIDSGKVIAGPGSSFRVAGLQLGQTLGVGGKDAAEVLSNTRTVIQSMAKAELDAAQQMKGQGQITEAERDIIRRAASGNIDSLTTGEVRQLADVMEKTGRLKIKSHRQNVDALSRMPNAAPLIPFYSVDEPSPYQPANGGWSIRPKGQ